MPGFSTFKLEVVKIRSTLLCFSQIANRNKEMTVKKGDIVELKIDKLIFGGAGLGRHDGQVVFVDYSAPGDVIEVEIFESKKNFSRGKILKIIEPSASRTQPRCKVFGQCGGCQWQHVNYEEQIASKQKILEDAVKRFLPQENVELGPFWKSPNAYHYRNRIQVRVDENGKIGFFEKGSHALVDIEKCPIAEEPLSAELIKMKQTNIKAGTYRIQVGLNNEVMRTHLEMQEQPLGFAQVNQVQNQKLQNEVLNIYEKYKGLPIIDLYGGYGDLSLTLAKQYSDGSIECVEWSHQSVEEGWQLAKKQNSKNLRYINMDVKSYLQRVHISRESFVILDPPREGCDSVVIQELVAKAPKCLVSISCDPMTWGRDTQLLLHEAQKNGYKYRIATMHGLDMFPQTDHIEVFSLLERQN